MKKILILHTSVGLGHKSIAENIGWHLEQNGFEVLLQDIGRVQEGKFSHAVIGVHQFINRNLPFVWGWLYRWGHYPVLPFRTFIAGFNYKTVQELVDRYNPDAIITTQTAASAVVNFLKQKNLYQGKFGIAFSDYHLHPYWLYPSADFYLANTIEQENEMAVHGISKHKIYVCGMTLRPKPEVDAALTKQKLGIGPNEKVVLVGTGSLGIGFKERDLIALSKLENTRIFFACGRNQALYHHLKNIKYGNITPLEFYKPMSELYAIADVFVSKPGGLSMAEALQWNLPVIVTFTLPGQEEQNVNYLAARKLIVAYPPDLARAVRYELETGEFRKQLTSNPAVRAILDRSDQVVEAVKGTLLTK